MALTNEPNIKGGRPLANRQPEVGEISRGGVESQSKDLVNRGGGTKKYVWVLGDPPSGKHCGTCLARAGKIRTAVG